MIPAPPAAPKVALAVACQDAAGTHAAGAVQKNAKGALGQALVQKFFEYAGWTVAYTGVESIVDHLMQLHRLNRGDLSKLPDFIISKVAGSKLNPATHPLGQAFYVEVKTWANWPTAGEDFSAYTKFGHVLLVWVSPKGLLATWLAKPSGDGSPKVVGDVKKVLESDFIEAPFVGEVSLEHCTDNACEKRLRKSFNDLSKTIAAIPA